MKLNKFIERVLKCFDGSPNAVTIRFELALDGNMEVGIGNQKLSFEVTTR